MPRWAFGAIVARDVHRGRGGHDARERTGRLDRLATHRLEQMRARAWSARRSGCPWTGIARTGPRSRSSVVRYLASRPAASDRLPVRQLWRSWCRRGCRGERGGRTPGRAGRGTVRRRRLGSARDRRKYACALLCERIGPGTVLGSRLDDPDDTRGVTTLCAQDRRLCAAVRGAERRPAGSHLHRRYGPRPRLSAAAGRRSPS